MTNAERWAERVVAWRASGLTSTEFASGRDFTAGGLRHWSHVLKKRAAEAASAATIEPAIRVARVALVAARADGVARSRGGTLTVEVGSARVVVPAGVDAETVEVVLGALLLHAAGGRAR